ncbi:RNA-binding S4 domain-containing protein [Coralloluteibacterium thermophilus]|uniref:Heat shock protein 15 n=1 Tax=Coralloluteibacterium thermophilum TaxID=2707049 RepID=A0ABV9NI10_9GAMM
MTATTETPPAIRLDLWLWAARFFKTRALAKQAIDNGRVRIGGAHCKPSRAVRAGERLEIVRGEERFEVDVLGVSDTRGPAPVAQTLYAETEASREARAAAREARRLAGPVAPPQRPDKKARRQIKSFKQADDGLPPWFPR